MYAKIPRDPFSARLFIVVVFSLVLSGTALALPWDVDMARQESLKSGEIARAPVKGTVPVGFRPFSMTIEEAEKKLSNPNAWSLNSVWRGKSVWNVNCTPCHGTRGDGKGPVGPLIGAPDLLSNLYKQKTDGRIFAVIYHGLRAMPRLGYKMSEEERWDVINYLRFLQGEEIQGMERPKE